MKSNLLISVALFLTLFSAQASLPTYNLLYNVSFITSNIEYYLDGLYYFGSYIYNSTSGNYTVINFPLNCSTFPTYNHQVQAYCSYYQLFPNGSYTYSFNLLNTMVNKVVASYQIATFPSGVYSEYVESGDYIIFIFVDAVNVGNISLKVFDMDTKTLVCPAAAINADEGLDTVYTDGNIFVYGYLDDNHNAHFVKQNCSTGERYYTEGSNEFQEINIFGFNGSTVFINFYIYQKNTVNNYYIQAGAFDSFNQLRFGNSINVTTFTQYNDTHFFISYYPNGKFTFGLFTISPGLQLVEVQSFSFGVGGPGFTANPVFGTSWISIVTGTCYLTYDVVEGAIIKIDSVISPILLSNGSVVNLTQYGYFIQDPNGPFFFVEAPFSHPTNGVYQDPVDTNQFYTLFVPGTNYNYYSKCLLTHFNITSSTITKTQFNNCPLSLPTGNPIQLKDVQFDSQGNPHIVYRDAYGSVYIVNPAGFNGPSRATYLYTTVQIGLNLTNGTFNFVGIQLQNIILGIVSISTGTLIQSKTIAASSYYNSLGKLSPRYYVIGYGGTASPYFEIYDLSTFQKISSVTSNLTTTFYSSTGIFVFGFNESSPANFTGLVYWNQAYVYLMNPLGETFVLNPGNIISVFDITPVGTNTFWASQYQTYVDGQVLYEVTDWGVGSTKKVEKPLYIDDV